MKRQGLAGDRPVVLQLAGGFGVGPIEQIFRGDPVGRRRRSNVVVVAGKNATAKKKLETVNVPKRHRVKVLGFTDQIDELMAAADVVVSQARRADDLGGARPRRGDGDRQSDPRPGEPQQRLPAGERRGDQDQQPPDAADEARGAARRSAAPQALRDNAKRIGRPQAAFDVAARALRMSGAGVGV